MRFIAGTKVRAIENYESRKERWLVQTANDPKLSRAGLRVAIAIGIHMNRKQNLLAWPGYGRLAKILGVGRTTAIAGVKALEQRGHMRVVRSRNGSKNAPNHYHPNLWTTQTPNNGVVTTSRPGGVQIDTRVVTQGVPEPMNEPMREPLKRRKEESVWRGGQVEKPKHPLAKPHFRRLVPTSEVMEILGIVPRGFRH
jgi:hypothetical protein